MSPLFVIFLTVFIDMVGFGIVIPVLPLYAEHFHATPVEIGWLTGIYSGMQIIFMPILGRLSDRFGRRPVLIVSLAGTALGFLIMGWASSLPLLFAARIIDGATGGNIATAQAYIADVSTPENRSRSMGLIGAAFGLGFTFGPMIGGIMSRISTVSTSLAGSRLVRSHKTEVDHEGSRANHPAGAARRPQRRPAPDARPRGRVRRASWHRRRCAPAPPPAR